jgi:hypothetical protein
MRKSRHPTHTCIRPPVINLCRSHATYMQHMSCATSTYSLAPTPHWTVHPHQPRGKARLDGLETPCYIATGPSRLQGLHRWSVFAVIDRDFNDNGATNSDLYEMRRICRECLRVFRRSAICNKSGDSCNDLATFPR